MRDRFLLYIDILGFSELVRNDVSKIDDLYEVIASLNANKHDAFKCIIFSDTILIYNVDGGEHVPDIRYLLMFMCEFVKDLMHRLTSRGVFFRAVITRGPFRHYELNSIPCFFGPALIRAYQSEKRIKAIGLFMERSLRQYSDIFRTGGFNAEYDFVYVTQALEDLERTSGGVFPFDKWYLEETDLIWMVTPELLHLIDLYKGSTGALPDHVKEKYLSTIILYERQYPKVTAFLKQSNFNIELISPNANWKQVVERHPESMSYAIKSRSEF